MKSRHWVPWVFVGIVCFLLCSWAALDSVARTAGLSGTDKRPQRFYGGRDGLKLFSEPGFSQTCIGTLVLNEVAKNVTAQ